MVLDTNVYSALAAAKKSSIDAISQADHLNIPLQVVGDLKYGFLKGSQKVKNEHTLERFLAQPQVSVVSPTIKTAAIYAEIQLYCVTKGKALSHNDVWIAALTQEINEPLVTYDKDFAVLSELWDKKLILLDSNN